MISIPFSGSKRNRYKEVKQIVQDHGYKKVYEAFGGSAVLSVNLFREGIGQQLCLFRKTDWYHEAFGLHLFSQ